MNVGELQSVLILDADQFIRTIDQVQGKARSAGNALEGAMKEGEQATVKTGQAVDKMGKELDKAPGKLNSVKGAFAAVSSVVAGSMIARYIGQSITAASDLNETVSKGRQIFGDNAAAVEAWGDTAAKAVGLSKQAALDAASNFGNLYTQIGYTADEAANLSTKTVQMAADLGSFNNLPTADVADRVSAAFRGEYDSLQLVIPTINAAKVETEALTATGKANAASLTAQEKAAAVLAIVNRDGARAMGDFARTSDGFANSAKTLTARVEEQKAALGEKLMPVALTVMELFSDVGVPALSAFGDVLGIVAGAIKPVVEALGWILRGFQGLPEPIQVAIVALAAVAAFRGPLSHLGDGMTGLTGKTKTLGAALKAAFITNPIGLAITAIATAFSIFSSSSSTAKEKAEDFKTKVDAVTASLDENTGAATENTRAWIRSDLGSKLDNFEKLGVTTRQVTDAMMGNAEAAKVVQDAILAAARSAVTATGEFAGMEGRMRDAGVSLQDLTAAALNQDWSQVNSQIALYNANLQAGQQPISLTMAEMNGLNGAVSGVRQNYNDLNGITGIVTTATGDLAAKVKDAGGVLRDAKDPASELAGVYDDGKVAAEELTKQVETLMRVMDEKAGRDGDAAAAQRALNATMREYADDLRAVPAAQREVQEADIALGEAKKALTDATRKHGAGSVEAAAASRDLAAAEDALAEAHQGAAEAADNEAASADKVRQAMVEAGQKAFNFAVQQGDVAGATDAATKAMAGVRQSFIDAQSPADIASGKAANLATQLGLIPEDVTPTITANAAGAQATIDGVKEQLTLLDGKLVTVTFKAKVDETIALLRSQGNPFAMAEGGLVLGGKVVHAAAGMVRQSQMLPGGSDVVHFAEPTIPWESYVSGDPKVSGRSNAIMGWTADRLGGTYLPPGVTVPAAAGMGGDGVTSRLDKLLDAIHSLPVGKTQLGEHVVIQQGDVDELLYRLKKQLGR